MFEVLLEDLEDSLTAQPKYVIEQCAAIPKPLHIIRPKPHKKLAYEDLRCTPKDRETIGYIISNVGERSKVWLLTNQSSFNKKGIEIEQVHPLKFLEVIFTNPYLTECMDKIFGDFWKRISFMPKMRSSLQARFHTRELIEHAKPFSEALAIGEEEVIQYLQTQEWDEFLHYLINAKRPQELFVDG